MNFPVQVKGAVTFFSIKYAFSSETYHLKRVYKVGAYHIPTNRPLKKFVEIS